MSARELKDCYKQIQTRTIVPRNVLFCVGVVTVHNINTLSITHADFGMLCDIDQRLYLFIIVVFVLICAPCRNKNASKKRVS